MTPWAFSEMEKFWERFSPRTPWGRREKDEKRLLADVASLECELDGVGHALRFLLAQPDAVPLVSESLARLPLLPRVSREMDATEIFLVKKFLLNAKRVWVLLDTEARDAFRVVEPPHCLLELLGDPDAGSCEESFYLSERYSTTLADVRAELRGIEGSLRLLREARGEAIVRATGIDLRYRDFVVLEASAAQTIPLDLFDLESCDSSHFLARPRLGMNELELAAGREAALAREKEEESKILAEISARICAEREALLGIAAVLTRLDIALAKAELANEFGMCRPLVRSPRRSTDGFFDMDSEGSNQLPLCVVQGRFLPLQWRCEKDAVKYWPLSATFDTRANVLLGSNMGGKSMALKTLCFLQLLAQMGFYVPAERFESCLFAQISCIVAASTDGEGLSSFGREIVKLGEAWANLRLPALFLVDEFARTTNSLEATALVAALLRRFAESPGTLGLVSTHFTELRQDFCQVTCFRMKGLNSSLFRSYSEKQQGGVLSERIQHLVRCMEYELLREEKVPQVRDAIHVAAALGLDDSILNFAKSYLEETYAGQAGPQP